MIINNPVLMTVDAIDQEHQMTVDVLGQEYQMTTDIAVIVTAAGERGEYSGSYEVTPTRETQVLETSGLVMSENVTIDPIPQNYGLITWDGATLMVS